MRARPTTLRRIDFIFRVPGIVLCSFFTVELGESNSISVTVALSFGLILLMSSSFMDPLDGINGRLNRFGVASFVEESPFCSGLLALLASIKIL